MERLGVTDSAIEKAIRAGHLHRASRGTFGVGVPPTGEIAHMMAAVLACGGEAVLSHLSAAWLLGLRDRPPGAVELIARGKAGRDLTGIRRHYVRPPRGPERGSCRGIPCTSPSRTIIDLAGMLGERSLRHVVERAAVLRLLDARTIEHQLAESRRRGAPTLRVVLRPWHSARPSEPAGDRTPASDGASNEPHLRSELEARLLALIRANDLPTPLCNRRIACGDGNTTIEVDFLWSERRVVVETDGKSVHDNPLAFERDRKRDRDLQLSGYRVLRFTHRQVEQEPDVAISAIRRLLAATSSEHGDSQRDFR